MAFAIDTLDVTRQLDPHDPCGVKPPVPKPMKTEPIIAHKVYDSCRAQDCLTLVAHAAEYVIIDGHHIDIGDVLPVPDGTETVTIDRANIEKTLVTSKKPLPFKKGYWDIEIEFTLEYLLTFHGHDREIILCVKAFSTSKRKYHLFGSVGSNTTISSDFPMYAGQHFENEGEPFVMVEGKAVALNAEIRHSRRDRHPADIAVTIGLFSIVKLFRIVCLAVESKGFCIPRECGPDCPIDPCKFFGGLEFPAEVFAPPSRER